MLFDTHAHYDDDWFDEDRDTLLSSLPEKGVGLIVNPGITVETSRQAIARELAEETGYTAQEWIEIGDYYPTPAYCDERITLYLARGLQLGQRHLDEDEFLNFEAIPLSELLADVMAGRITDGKTQVAVLKAARILGL